MRRLSQSIAHITSINEVINPERPSTHLMVESKDGEHDGQGSEHRRGGLDALSRNERQVRALLKEGAPLGAKGMHVSRNKCSQDCANCRCWGRKSLDLLEIHCMQKVSGWLIGEHMQVYRSTPGEPGRRGGRSFAQGRQAGQLKRK